MSEYIDIGVNLTGSSFKNDLNEVMQRALSAGVRQMIVTGTDVDHSKAAIDLCQQYPDRLYSTAGIHPHHADDCSNDTRQYLYEVSQNNFVVAVGECGLDYNRNYSTPENQRMAFESQLALAVDTNLPVFLHQRDAHDDFVSMLANCMPQLKGGVAHCFTGTTEEAVEYLEMGLHIGITGWICDERRGKSLQQAVREIPLDRILLETDAPYLLPRDLDERPVQTRRNEPCYLPHVASVVARHMQVDIEELQAAALENTKRFFAI